MGGRDSDVDLTFIPFSLTFLISSDGFSVNRMKCHYYTAHRRFNHSIVAEHLSSRLLSLQFLFLVSGVWPSYKLLSVTQTSVTLRNATKTVIVKVLHNIHICTPSTLLVEYW